MKRLMVLVFMVCCSDSYAGDLLDAIARQQAATQPRLPVVVGNSIPGCAPCEIAKRWQGLPFEIVWRNNPSIAGEHQGLSFPAFEYLNKNGKLRRVWGVDRDSLIARWKSGKHPDRKYYDGVMRAVLKPNPDHQPTPQSQIPTVLVKLNLTPSDTLVDYGCGDARVLIAAANRYGCKGIGVEIDSYQAKKARAAVERAGLTSTITIIEGDATKVDVKATKAFVYLWPETLEKLAPKLRKLDAVASYQHEVPGLGMTKQGEAWYLLPAKSTTQRVIVGYKNVKYCNGRRCWYQRVPIYGYRTVTPRPQATTRRSKPYAIWSGRYYTGRVCNSRFCTMCNSIAAQLR